MYVGLSGFYRWDGESCGGFTAAGNASSMICGVISHVLDFRGASLCVDTACASGLSALALAVAEVGQGRAEGAIAVGALARIRAPVSPSSLPGLPKFVHGCRASMQRCNVTRWQLRPGIIRKLVNHWPADSHSASVDEE